MRRRAFLSALAVGSAGCLARGGGYTIPPVLEDPPEGVYVPTHGADLAVVGVADAEPFRLGLCYSYPDRFWEVVGRTRYLREIEPDDSIHLMALAWDPQTGVVLPEVGLTVEVRRGGELVAQEAVYAMVSQRLGFHYGDNVALPGDGDYEVTVRVGGLSLRRTGAFANRFAEPASATFSFPYRRADRDALSTTLPTDAGEPGAMEPAEAPGLPSGVAPAVETLPGTLLDTTTVDGATLAATLLQGTEASRFDADRYLAVSARTPYNEMVLPSMGLRIAVVETGFETVLTRTMDPRLGYHYGTAIPELPSNATLRVETLTPPQVARHEGYETAFVEMPSVELRS